MAGILGMLAGSAISGGLGYLFNRLGQQSQIDQQGQLMGMQIRGAKELADYNQKIQMENWEKTNYNAQVEQLKKAGLNPGLLYGMSGGGGATTGGGGGGMPSVATAEGPSASTRNVMDMMMMQSQMKLTNAQAESAAADAELKRTETEKKAGVDTDKVKAEIDNLLQGYDNLRQQHTIGNLEITMRNILNYEKQATQENRMQEIATNAKKGLQELQLLQNEAKLSDDLYNSKVTKFKTEVIGASIHNALMQAGIKKTESDIRVNQQQIQNWYEDNMRAWDQMNFEERKVKVQELLANWNTDPNIKAVDQITKLLDNIIFVSPKLK